MTEDEISSMCDSAIETARKYCQQIKPADINELKGMRKPTDTTRLILDALQILFQGKMIKCSPGTISMLKLETKFLETSFDAHSC